MNYDPITFLSPQLSPKIGGKVTQFIYMLRSYEDSLADFCISSLLLNGHTQIDIKMVYQIFQQFFFFEKLKMYILRNIDTTLYYIILLANYTNCPCKRQIKCCQIELSKLQFNYINAQALKKKKKKERHICQSKNN